MRGYYQDMIVHKAVDAEGWMELPDRIQCLDRRLKVLGRRDRMFQVAGENVSAAEILHAIESLRGSADFLVLPIVDPIYGHRPVLVVRSLQKPDYDRIVACWQAALPGIKRPVQILWHATNDVSKPSQDYYTEALHRGELALLWKQDHGKV